MIENEEMPIGFMMELSKHLDSLSRFASLSEAEQKAVADGARTIDSKSEMRNYVENIMKA